MILAYTGTRQGMSLAQKTEVNLLVRLLKPTILHHGCCHGGDRDMHAIAGALHPAFDLWPSDSEQMTWAKEQWAMETHYMLIHAIRPPLERNDLMAQRCHVLIATPAQHFEVLRSGTWATIRYARNHNKRLYIVFPDGTTKEEPYG